LHDFVTYTIVKNFVDYYKFIRQFKKKAYYYVGCWTSSVCVIFVI